MSEPSEAQPAGPLRQEHTHIVNSSDGGADATEDDDSYNFAAFYTDADVAVPTLDVSMLPEIVADLSAAGEVHDRRFDTLGQRVTELDNRARRSATAVQQLVDGFAALEVSLVDKANFATPSRWAWQFLTAEDSEQLWREVRWFVDQFVARYPLANEVALPPCWYRHALALDELTAVYAAWREAFCGTSRPTSSLAAWWDRWLWPCLLRLSAYADWRECKQSRKHVEPAARQEPTDDDFEKFVASDIQQRSAERSEMRPWIHG